MHVTIRDVCLAKWGFLVFSLREEASLQTLTQDVFKTSEIEGEVLDLV